MTVPPYLIDMRIDAPSHRPVNLWLPLFLLWPLLLVLGVLALVLTILADIVLWAVGQPYHRYTFFLIRCFLMLGDLRGTSVDVRSTDSLVHLVIR